jgi:3-oxoacyl-[acyl-carrier-protein] synthase II
MHRRVVLTGAGVVAPNGIGIEAFWKSLLENRSGIDVITRFDTTGYPIRIAGEVKGFRLSDFVDWPVRAGRLARHTELAVAAFRMAMNDARLDSAALRGAVPVPVIFGVGTGALDVFENAQDSLTRRGPKRMSPHFVSACQPHAVAVELVRILGVRATMLTFSSACGSGLDAAAHAFGLIRCGKTEMAITGGADSNITPVSVASFFAAGMVPSLNGEDPRKVSRPFDRERRGGIMAEGAAVLVLERLEHALARGAHIYCEICGFGSSAEHDEESGSGLERSMRQALSNACASPGRVDYLCAHGPSDPLLDRVETRMIRRVFGAAADRLPVTSIKGATGNPLSAAGPMELVTAALVLARGVIPPTTNYEFPDPDCDLDYVPFAPRETGARRALINLHGLGGGNVSVFLRALDAE